MRRVTTIAALFVVVSSVFAQTQTIDADYKTLREAVPAESFLIENLTLERDVVHMTLRSGAVTFLTPVQDKRMLAVFRGEATFELDPVFDIDRASLAKIAGSEKPNVSFQRMLIAFSDSTYEEVKKTGKAVALDTEAASVLADFRKKIRKNPDNNDNV